MLIRRSLRRHLRSARARAHAVGGSAAQCQYQRLIEVAAGEVTEPRPAQTSNCDGGVVPEKFIVSAGGEAVQLGDVPCSVWCYRIPRELLCQSVLGVSRPWHRTGAFAELTQATPEALGREIGRCRSMTCRVVRSLCGAWCSNAGSI
jgi:hypothetical protein